MVWACILSYQRLFAGTEGAFDLVMPFEDVEQQPDKDPDPVKSDKGDSFIYLTLVHEKAFTRWFSLLRLVWRCWTIISTIVETFITLFLPGSLVRPQRKKSMFIQTEIISGSGIFSKWSSIEILEIRLQIPSIANIEKLQIPSIIKTDNSVQHTSYMSLDYQRKTIIN